MIYMKLHNVPFGLVLYFAKNTSEIKEHVVVWDDDVWNDIVDSKIKPVLEAEKTGTLPEPTISAWTCRNWCPFFYGCPHWRDGNAKPDRHTRRLRKLRGG
jgi:hypothetical protein